MISSPCAKCIRKDQPKDECVDNCRALHEIQVYQVSLNEFSRISAINYVESGRFAISTAENEITDYVM